MTETSPSLPLFAYRSRIDLDTPFVPRHAAGETERLELIEMVIGHLERDGTGCARLMDAQGHLEPTGAAKVTRAYNLPSRFVIHTVGPIVDGTPTSDDDARLVSVYRASLDLAHEIGSVRSVVLCGVSTGVFGFPREPAARLAVQTVRAWLREHPTAFDQIVFNVFADADRAAYAQALFPGSSQ